MTNEVPENIVIPEGLIGNPVFRRHALSCGQFELSGYPELANNIISSRGTI
ncbi:MAG: hypothetical protein M0R70_05425 [Nitrospirae bacterium]|nr:hypothetical protein [Nitrospirota bacterium]